MASKALMVLGFLLVALVLISSEVAARELAEDAKGVQTNEAVKDGYGGRGGGYPGHGGGGGYPGHGGGGGYPGHGGGGGYPGHGGGGGYCRYGRCCRYGHCKCCNYAGEMPDSQAEAKPQN